MPSRMQALAEHHAQLVARCDAERARATAALQSIKGQIATADRGLESAGRWFRNPVVIAAGVAVLLVVSRSRPWRGAGAVAGLLAAGLRARGIARSMRSLQKSSTARS